MDDIGSLLKIILKVVGLISAGVGIAQLISLTSNYVNNALTADSSSEFGLAFGAFILGILLLKFG